MFVRPLENVRIKGQAREAIPRAQLDSEKLAVRRVDTANEEKGNDTREINHFCSSFPFPQLKLIREEGKKETVSKVRLLIKRQKVQGKN